jgi:hypothetical protein
MEGIAFIIRLACLLAPFNSFILLGCLQDAQAVQHSTAQPSSLPPREAILAEIRLTISLSSGHCSRIQR